MPYKDPEEQREWDRRRYQRNREKILERTRLRRQTPEGREANRLANQRNYWANPERRREYTRAWGRANPERVKEQSRRWREEGGLTRKQRRRNEAVARLWDEQEGRCYLCTRPVPVEEAHLDHDHRCCPHEQFCSFCIRGAACRGCNHAIGNAEDDPDRLEVIARNLRAKLAEMEERLASKPQQLSLEEAG